MDIYDVRRLAMVSAVNSEVEGMKADNLMNPTNHNFKFQDFQDKAEELRNLAYVHNDQM